MCLGGSLNVKCSTSADKLEWNAHYGRSWSRELSYLGTAEMATPIESMNMAITLHISRSLNESTTDLHDINYSHCNY